ncbi:MAG: glycosyltransferase family 2 protein [Leptolyngbyaceae cyanobacterium]
MHYPKITIVTPSFNQSRYLEQTIQSVIGQGYPNLEYIIMDGGSTDGSVEIIEKYSRYIDYWCSKPDDGQADAIFRGFKRSTGHILSWINSDDILCDRSLFKVADTFRENSDLGLVFGNSFLINESSKFKRCLIPDPNFKYYLYGASSIFQGSVFYTRDAYIKSGGINPKWFYSMEYELFLNIHKDNKVSYIPYFIGCFRIQPLAKSSNYQELGRQEYAAIFKNVLDINIHGIEYKLKRVLSSVLAKSKPSFIFNRLFRTAHQRRLYSKLVEHCS